MNTTAIVDDLRRFNWKEILTIGNSLEDLNDRQWRWLKAVIIETAIEKYGVNGIKYVAEDHRDHVWPAHNISVEVKSVLSCSMYQRKNRLRKRYNIMFSNSMGTNSKDLPDENQVAEIILCVYNDGVFALDGRKSISKMKSNGDGFVLSVTPDDVIQITGKMTVEKRSIDFKKHVQNKIGEII